MEGKWVVECKIGEGTFSEIYQVVPVPSEGGGGGVTQKPMALKLDKMECKTSKLGQESDCLLALNEGEEQCCPRHIYFGEVCLGPDLTL